MQKCVSQPRYPCASDYHLNEGIAAASSKKIFRVFIVIQIVLHDTDLEETENLTGNFVCD